MAAARPMRLVMMRRVVGCLLLSLFVACQGQPQVVRAEDAAIGVMTARASEIDPRAAEHPEIDFVFETDGKPQDVQHALVNPDAPQRGQLVVWLMGYNQQLFERLASYGYHVVQPHYARAWFGIVKPTDRMARGLVRLEAATGKDVSPQVAIPFADGMAERTHQFVRHLAREQPAGRWEQFLSEGGAGIDWTKVIITGASHGSTTAARFAKEVEVARVVMLCGPRDQEQDWQSLPSATPPERFFGFSHVLDSGWSGDHYCRSWELLGLTEFGPIVNVDGVRPPYGNTRRLVSAADVGGDAGRAHSAVTPGRASPRDAEGHLLYEPVWEYLFTHPVDQVGSPVPRDPDCEHDHPL